MVETSNVAHPKKNCLHNINLIEYIGRFSNKGYSRARWNATKEHQTVQIARQEACRRPRSGDHWCGEPRTYTKSVPLLTDLRGDEKEMQAPTLKCCRRGTKKPSWGRTKYLCSIDCCSSILSKVSVTVLTACLVPKDADKIDVLIDLLKTDVSELNISDLVEITEGKSPADIVMQIK